MVAGEPGPSSAAPTTGYPAVRVEAAKETGRFFLRCLGGGSRGLSGRERVQLPNRIYVLVRDIEGRISTSPVRVYKSYNQLHPFVKRGQSLGDSVFPVEVGSSIGSGDCWIRLAQGDLWLKPRRLCQNCQKRVR